MNRSPDVFGPDVPEFAPVDRLAALHDVAGAARAYRDSGNDPNLEATWQVLVSALARLDRIERHMGIGHPIVNTISPHGAAS